MMHGPINMTSQGARPKIQIVFYLFHFSKGKLRWFLKVYTSGSAASDVASFLGKGRSSYQRRVVVRCTKLVILCVGF